MGSTSRDNFSGPYGILFFISKYHNTNCAWNVFIYLKLMISAYNAISKISNVAIGSLNMDLKW